MVKHSGSEVTLAKSLASADLNERMTGLRILKSIVTQKDSPFQSFSDLQHQKLWKGLMYFYWYSDGLVKQAEMASKIGCIIDKISNTSSAVKFIRGFFHVIGVDWDGIDRYRVDKYYMLFESVFTRFLAFYVKHYHDDSIKNQIINIVSKYPASSSLDSCFCDDLRYFTSEIFWKSFSTLKDSSSHPWILNESGPEIVASILRPFWLNLLNNNEHNAKWIEHVKSLLCDFQIDMFAEPENENSQNTQPTGGNNQNNLMNGRIGKYKKAIANSLLREVNEKNRHLSGVGNKKSNISNASFTKKQRSLLLEFGSRFGVSSILASKLGKPRKTISTNKTKRVPSQSKHSPSRKFSLKNRRKPGSLKLKRIIKKR